MKKFLLITICIAIASNITAQQYLNKYLRGDVGSDTLIKQAVEGCAVIVKQSYQVKNKKTGSLYGRSGRKDFGHNYTIGVKTEAGLILTDDALKPWLFDSAFKKVEQEYDRMISLTEIREIGKNKSNKFNQCPLKMGRNQPNGVWIANANKVQSNEMEIDLDKGERYGWMIWFMVNKDLDEEPNVDIITKTASLKHEVIIGGDDLDVNPPTGSGKLLGGIYVCPVFNGGGHVTFRLAGIAIEEGELWKLRTPFAGFSFEKAIGNVNSEEKSEAEVDTTKDDDREVELTPIDKDKKNKKSKKGKK